MNITIDLRSLHTNQYSGVEHFTASVIEQLLEHDSQNRYTLFYNGFTKRQFDQFHHVNVQYKQTRIPNRLLNLSQKIFGWPQLEYLAGRTDSLIMPNPSIAKIRSTTKLILVVHDLSPLLMPEMYTLKSRLWQKMVNIPKLVKRADRVLTVSEYTKQSLIDQLGADPEKITVGLLGVNHDQYHPELSGAKLREVRNKFNLPVEFVVFVGTLEPRKNVENIIAALRLLPSHIHLVIAGKLGWKYSQIIKQMQTNIDSRRIHYIGYVPEVDKPYLLKLARVLVWPSLYEGFGLPLLEAMAVGTPVVTSNLTAIPEVVGDAAIMVNPYNVTDIADAVNLLLEDSQLRDQYIQKGLLRAQGFTWQKTAESLKSLL